MKSINACDDLEKKTNEECPIPVVTDGWREAFRFTDIINHVHQTGTHFLKEESLRRLVEIRRELQESLTRFPEDKLNSAFVETLLDKHDDRYNYESYLSLALLGQPITKMTKDWQDGYNDCRRRILHLVADLVSFEIQFSKGQSRILPLQKPPANVLKRRLASGQNILKHYLCDNWLEAKEVPKEVLDIDKLEMQCDSVIKQQGSCERLRVLISIQPVYISHDEYMFIRILQCFEIIFSWSSKLTAMAIDACYDPAGGECACLQAAVDLLREGLGLFSILTTMQREAFQSFRNYTEGASAIQSQSYKKLESLCQTPDRDRLNSIAYDAVPSVKASVLTRQNGGVPNLFDAYRELGMHAFERAENLKATMIEFDAVLKKWKYSHYGVAVKMLGDKTGTGYTEGTPYLERVKDVPLFGGLKNATD